MTGTMTARGLNGTIHFDGQSVQISRSGVIARASVGKGTKTIPVASITAVQWKPAGLSAGMIQFTLSGGTERRSRFGRQSRDAMHDENSVTFHLHRQGDFRRLADAVRSAITGHAYNSGGVAGTAFAEQPAPHQPVAQGPPPGWYRDPDGTEDESWWDGSTWTGHKRPATDGP